MMIAKIPSVSSSLTFVMQLRDFSFPQRSTFFFLHTIPRHSVLYNCCQRHQLSLSDIKMGGLSFAGGKKVTKQSQGEKDVLSKEEQVVYQTIFIYILIIIR